MRKIWLIVATLISLGMLLVVIWRPQQPSVLMSTVVPKETASPKKTLKYEQGSIGQSIVHTLLIPANSGFLVTPALSQQLNTVEEFAQKSGASAVLNGGFFDPINQKTTSYFHQGNIIADPRQNERLVNNPDLKLYINKILNRTEFRRYLCGQNIRYDIALHSEPPPTGCQLVDALGGGPRLLPEITLVQEGFLDNANGRDALGSTQPNARSAVGITSDGSIILAMVAQKPDAPANGMSLPELANFLKSLGVEKAMNLDGGSSSSFYYNGLSFYGKVDKRGNPVKRKVKSVLLVQGKLDR